MGNTASARRFRVVAFDMGGTLEDVSWDDTTRREAARALRAFLVERGLDPGMRPEDLQAAIQAGMNEYQDWRETSEIELPPERVWTDFVFSWERRPQRRPPDWVPRLTSAAEEIAEFYESTFFVRRLRPEAAGALAALRERGFRLAVISNVTSRRLVPRNLVRYGLDHFFDAVVTSAEFGRRKPDASIFLEAARLMGVPPAACAYVGDTVSRDVIGARRAGYGLAIQIKSFLTGKADQKTAGVLPDAVIDELGEVVDLVARETGPPCDLPSHAR